MVMIVRLILRMQGIDGVIISLAIKRLCCNDTINIIRQETSGPHISKTSSNRPFEINWSSSSRIPLLLEFSDILYFLRFFLLTINPASPSSNTYK